MSTVVATLWLVSAALLSLMGCVLLALSQPRNWRRVLGDRKAESPKTATAGWLFVGAALLPCVLRDGGSFAALLWPLTFAFGAAATAMVLTFRPQWLRSLARRIGG